MMMYISNLTLPASVLFCGGFSVDGRGTLAGELGTLGLFTVVAGTMASLLSFSIIQLSYDKLLKNDIEHIALVLKI